MKTLQFKTNINCGNCVRAITPTLNQEAGAGSWQVDTVNPDKLLTVTSATFTAAEVIAAVEKAGFEIQSV